MGKGAVCKSCFQEIPAGEPWHYRYDRKAGLFEPIHDKCPPKKFWLERGRRWLRITSASGRATSSGILCCESSFSLSRSAFLLYYDFPQAPAPNGLIAGEEVGILL